MPYGDLTSAADGGKSQLDAAAAIPSAHWLGCVDPSDVETLFPAGRHQPQATAAPLVHLFQLTLVLFIIHNGLLPI
jgi:hypothetical protein